MGFDSSALRRVGSCIDGGHLDVAGLVAAALLRKNPHAQVIPFEHDVVRLRLNPRDSVMTTAQKLASVGGGGTNCSAPLARLNKERAQVDTVIYVSDNESWVDASADARGTAMMNEWMTLRRRSPQAKLVCIDLTPNTRTQAMDVLREDPGRSAATALRAWDILNVGGFSDAVFEIVAEFAKVGSGASWAEQVDQIEL